MKKIGIVCCFFIAGCVTTPQKIELKSSEAPKITQASPDVPKSCAPFVGLWSGNWPGFGQTWLWVTEVNAQCVATYAHRTKPQITDSRVFKKAEIKNSILSFPDYRGDTDTFKLNGDELYASHQQAGSNNSAVFRRVDIERK
jgi:hypothetical protein